MNNLWSDKQNFPCCTPVMMDASTLDDVIVFAPHADDESIGCGGLIALLCDMGKRVTLVMVSDSSGAGGLCDDAIQIRKKELEKASEILGIKEEIIFWDIPDGEVSQCLDLSKRIAAIASEKKALCALAPWILDSHGDHAAVGRAVMSAHKTGSFPNGIWFYEVWTPLCATHILSINDVWERKKEALTAHITALSCANYLRAVEGLAMYRSLLGIDLGREGCYAEGYHFAKHHPTKEILHFRDAHNSDGEAVTRLFTRVFESIPPPGWWDWKYAQRTHIGSVGTRANGDIVSFYGSLERIMIADGLEYNVCQLGDVMVSQHLRGWGGRKGIFYHTSFAFLNQYVGDGKTFAIGFGFPTPRALALGIRLGLYRRADALMLLHVQCANSALEWGMRMEVLTASEIKEWEWIDSLDSPIEKISPTSVWMKKSSIYWKWRYGSHPDTSYLIVRLRRLGKILGAAVLKETSQGMELMDIVFLEHHFLSILKGVQKVILQRNGTLLSVWGSERAIITLHSSLGGEMEDAGYLTLPGEILGASISKKVLNRLWLLGGDTDFR